MTTDLVVDQVIGKAITNLLSNGVPTGPISRSFGVDQALVKELQANIRVHKYGSEEISELLSALMFDAYLEARTIMKHGSPAMKSKMIGMVLGRAMSLVNRQSPEAFERVRAEMMALMGDIKNVDGDEPSLYPESEYSPIDDDSDDE